MLHISTPSAFRPHGKIYSLWYYPSFDKSTSWKIYILNVFCLKVFNIFWGNVYFGWNTANGKRSHIQDSKRPHKVVHGISRTTFWDGVCFLTVGQVFISRPDDESFFFVIRGMSNGLYLILHPVATYITVFSASPGFPCHTHWISLVKPYTKRTKHISFWIFNQNSFFACTFTQFRLRQGCDAPIYRWRVLLHLFMEKSPC